MDPPSQSIPLPISAIPPIPGLYISDIVPARSPETLSAHGITHVLSLVSARSYNPYEDLVMCLEGVCEWIKNALEPGSGLPARQVSEQLEEGKEREEAYDEARSRGKGKVLVHCLQGQSRSGAIVVAYLMRALALNYDAALVLARQHRPVIDLNPGFADQLRLWQGWEFSIFNSEGGEIRTKAVYETWKADRGVLLSKAQVEMNAELMRQMKQLAGSDRVR
ncbi:protein-tyrosine phosphatase-like protein [Bisporella sp. PMI_857]|nr:protein-tyrosine phosphatase-like protein [Bisporella sp. PMI_857]